MIESFLHPETTQKPQEHIAALDLGTNSCRLLIAALSPEGYQVVDSFVRVIRLGDELATKGHISKEATQRAVNALTICAEKIKAYPLKRSRYIATAACRDASNRDVFLKEIQTNTGLELEVISTAEEARLAIMGCADLFDSSTRYAITFDIGGGSTEVMWLEILPHKLPEIIAWTSLPLGVVTVGETLRHEPNPTLFLNKIRKAVAKEIKSFSDKAYIYPQLRKKNVQLIGTRGTVTTLASLYMNLDRYDHTKVHGLQLTPEMIKKTIANLYSMTPEDRLLHPAIGPMRTELVMGGMAIFEGIYDVFPINPLHVADRGVREGILLDLIQS
ncbi:MAG: Ppx/GppA family phosphatase [Alphaproteobacteria bacterium]|jgi:exopolyphosphatase/guanosine-5'-triphosphate,3'-diphosphate pyrophosphatase|nr:Ppx/GppA family phosphatase [Alphaproteobacteria bacterium]MBP9776653.1 Ppx/GppA family phosphatase [Alphaproteobacteria bacterium]